MARARLLLLATRAVIRKDWEVFLSYRTRPLTQLLSSVMTLILFYYVARLVRGGTFGTPASYFAFVAVGIVALRLINALVSQPAQAFMSDLAGGTFERMAATPLGPTGTLLAGLVFPFLQAVAFGVLMLALAVVAFGLDVRWGTAALYFPVAALSAFAIAPLAVFGLAAVVSTKQALSAAGFAVGGLALIGGLYFPASVLPGALSWLADIQPVTPAVDLMRSVIIGRHAHPPGLEVLKLVAFAAVLLPVSVVVLRLAVRRQQRAGTLLEF